jgi:hypothetical protein
MRIKSNKHQPSTTMFPRSILGLAIISALTTSTSARVILQNDADPSPSRTVAHIDVRQPDNPTATWPNNPTATWPNVRGRQDDLPPPPTEPALPPTTHRLALRQDSPPSSEQSFPPRAEPSIVKKCLKNSPPGSCVGNPPNAMAVRRQSSPVLPDHPSNPNSPTKPDAPQRPPSRARVVRQDPPPTNDPNQPPPTAEPTSW